MKIQIRCKRNLRYIVLTKALSLLLSLRLITPKRACSLFNREIDKGELKIKVGNSDWRAMTKKLEIG